MLHYKLCKIFDEIIDLAKKNDFRGYDPLSFEDLYFVGKYLHNPSKINRVLRLAEKSLLYFIPAEKYLRLLKLPRYTLQYGDALLVQALVKQFRNTANKGYIDTARLVLDYSLPTLGKTANGLGVCNPKEVKNVKAGVSSANATTVYLPGSSEYVFALCCMFEATADSKYLAAAQAIVLSFVNDYNQKKWSNCICLDYSNAGDNTHILNANALAAAAICKVQELSGEKIHDNFIEGIYNFLRYNFDQEKLPYADARDMAKLGKENCMAYDVYHTGFTIRGMYEICSYLSQETAFLESHVTRFFNDFVVDGKVVFMENGWLSRRTIDIHGLAEFVLMFANFRSWLSSEKQLALMEILLDNITSMRNNGQFTYRKIGPLNVNIYMPRWAEFSMANSIAAVCFKDSN